jgi:GNAT superfamily N-acetyltransferase
MQATNSSRTSVDIREQSNKAQQVTMLAASIEPRERAVNPQIEVHPESDLSSQNRAELEDWFSREFGHTPYRWASPDWYVVALLDSILVGRLGIVERSVAAGAHTIPVGGVSGVITHWEWRGGGIARAVLNRAMVFIASELEADFALLLCRQEIAPFYTRLGWKLVQGATTFLQPTGKVVYPKLTMVYACGEGRWPDGAVDLCGLPW